MAICKRLSPSFLHCSALFQCFLSCLLSLTNPSIFCCRLDIPGVDWTFSFLFFTPNLSLPYEYMMSPNLSSFFSTVPVYLSNAKHRPEFTVSHAVFSQALGHLTPGLCPLRFFSVLCRLVWLGSQVSIRSSLTVPTLLSSMTGVLISCELWLASCRYISFNWLDWLCTDLINVQVLINVRPLSLLPKAFHFPLMNLQTPHHCHLAPATDTNLEFNDFTNCRSWTSLTRSWRLVW